MLYFIRSGQYVKIGVADNWVQFPDPREDGLCATYPTLDGGFYISLEAARKTKR